MRVLLALALCAPLTISVLAPGARGEEPAPLAVDSTLALGEVLAEAKQTGKPVVVDFYTTWCKPCKMFDEQILPDAAVQQALAGVIYVRYDAEDGGNGTAAAERYKVNSYPSFLALDDTGAVRARFEGMPDTPQPFLNFVAEARTTAGGEPVVVADVKAAPKDARVLLRAARWYAARRRAKEALALYDRAGKADKGNALGVAADAMWESGRLGRGAKLRKETVAAAAAFVKKYPYAPRADEALRVAVLSGDLPAKAVKALLAARRQAADDDRSGPGLNSVTYIALAAGDNDEALAAAELQVELLPRNANAYDTLAEVHHYRGEQAKALAAEDQALALAGDDKQAVAVLKANRDRFAQEGAPTPSPDVARERQHVAAYLAALEHPGEHVATPAPEGPQPTDATQKQIEDEMKAFFIASRKAYGAAESSCKDLAGKLEEAYVRVELTDVGGVPSRVVVLEPDAPAKLKKCLVDALTKEKFPKAPFFFRGRYTEAVHFGSGAFGIEIKPPKSPK